MDFSLVLTQKDAIPVQTSKILFHLSYAVSFLFLRKIRVSDIEQLPEGSISLQWELLFYFRDNACVV